MRFTLPLFGNLGRSVSASNISSPTELSGHQSLSNPNLPETLSPTNGKPIYMPDVSRIQRRASLVGT